MEEIEKQQKSSEEEANALIQELEQELSILFRSTKMETLPFRDQSTWTDVRVSQPSYGRVMLTTVNLLKGKLTQQMETLLDKAKLSRAQQFAVDVTLDPNTAHPNLTLSHDGKQVYSSSVKQNLPDNPERFDSAVNALGKHSFSSGRFYYEVQVEGKTSWDLGVARESVNRKGSINASPENGFWTIGLRTGGIYKASTVHLSVKSPLKKVGVLLDYEKGLVSFFDVDCAEIIHSFKDCSFKEKLYPFFSPGTHRDGQNSRPLIICPVSHD
ncbi:E3 ubiquitin-protein ligase TRIM21-like [Salarias fasciatus]|uniref:E3 ubiquitin-protein ligase TRIM21-like n=1 Tax=Salarias fasciatus TaxID=181472 RepID=UPI001176909A|nr:E3 ubiquitin-protein ligase TRIM21-like [Salarias fasciatus]